MVINLNFFNLKSKVQKKICKEKIINFMKNEIIF